MNAYRQKKIAMISDLSGYGRYFLIVVIPILSAMKVQYCPIPTSILSNHTGFPVYLFSDYTEKMEEFIHKWKELRLTFNGIVSGFLGSEAQTEIMMDIIWQFRQGGTKVIIGPTMGDRGGTYVTYTPTMCNRMKELVSMGDVVTPNLTEVYILTGRTYRGDRWNRKGLGEPTGETQAMGPEYVVITGINQGGFIMNVVVEDERTAFPRARRVGHKRLGTGNVFFSVVSATTVGGWSLDSVVRLAASLVEAYITRSEELDIPTTNGVRFEELMNVLIRAANSRHEAGKLTERVGNPDSQGRPGNVEKY